MIGDPDDPADQNLMLDSEDGVIELPTKAALFLIPSQLTTYAKLRHLPVCLVAQRLFPFVMRRRTEQQHSAHVLATYLPVAADFKRVVAVMDWHSRTVLSWEVSASMDESFCVNALERALRLYPKPDISNTDQGSQFTSKAFTGVLQDHQIRISMDGKGRCMDNIFIERLWRSVKYDEIYLNDYATTEELRKALRKYFHFYNEERPHQTFDGKTPLEVYTASISDSVKRIVKVEGQTACALVGDSGYAALTQAEACG